MTQSNASAWARAGSFHIAFGRLNWGWAIFRAFWVLPQLRWQVGQYLREDIELGVAQGVFTAAVDDFFVEMLGSLINAALFAQMNGTVGREAGSKVAESQLPFVGGRSGQGKRGCAGARLNRVEA
jgi:hypothetical protein